MKKILVVCSIIMIVLVLGYIIMPKPLYEKATWTRLGDGGSRKFQFSKYTLPENYKMLAYLQGMEDRKSFVLFQNKDTGQYFGACILRELPKVSFDKLEFDDNKITRTVARYYTFDIETDPNFKLIYLIPFLINEDYGRDLHGGIVRGMRVGSKEYIDTEKTKVLLVSGGFGELGFYRISKNLFIKYPVPVFSFKNSMNGMVAVVNNKVNGDTIFAFGCTDSYKDFDKTEFINIIKSMTFDKEPRSLQDLVGSGAMKKYSK